MFKRVKEYVITFVVLVVVAGFTVVGPLVMTFFINKTCINYINKEADRHFKLTLDDNCRIEPCNKQPWVEVNDSDFRGNHNFVIFKIPLTSSYRSDGRSRMAWAWPASTASANDEWLEHGPGCDLLLRFSGDHKTITGIADLNKSSANTQGFRPIVLEPEQQYALLDLNHYINRVPCMFRLTKEGHVKFGVWVDPKDETR
jgi:hypothetical protein